MLVSFRGFPSNCRLMSASDPNHCPIPDVTLTPLKVIEGAQGNIMHGMRSDDETFVGFGEVYFSTVHAGEKNLGVGTPS